MLKKIIFITTGVIVIAIIFYNLSVWNQKLLFKKYSYNFNSKRQTLGLRILSKDWSIEKFTWDNWYSPNLASYYNKTLLKYVTIFSCQNLQTGLFLKNKSVDKNRVSISKVISFNTNLLFWKNKIEAEIDTYEKEIDSTTTEEVTITYYFEDENGNKDYYETNHSTYYSGILYCGTPAIMRREEHRISRKPYIGNITKKQADSILESWNINLNEKFITE